ncbi:hypothetical protein [Micromonospora sp. LOL_021]|uniref:hypothetical protein n=1 Tax=Micromonospora sp. LOL_021 TaxID=3345417 RepID=UPI003A874ADF
MREIELREIRQNASELVCHAQADELATALSRSIVGEQVAKMPDIVTMPGRPDTRLPSSSA